MRETSAAVQMLVPVVAVLIAIGLVGGGLLLMDHGGGDRLADGPVPRARHDDQAGHAIVGDQRVSQVDIRRRTGRHERHRRARFFTWDVAGRSPATATAHGTGDGHYVVNSSLVGFRPFATKHSTVPRAVLVRRKTYQRERIQYDGRGDVWQTSREAWIALRGDCEDHALVLADWLIEMGLEARVAVGTHDGGGHAWVVVIGDAGEQYLLEAIGKRGRARALPRAGLAQGYRSGLQFDREHFWVNTGSRRTRDYAGDQWHRRGRFVRAASG